MTTYFEVLTRDGPARLGELRLDTALTTPACADDVLRDAGSTWSREREVPPPTTEAVTILPARGIPPGTPEQIANTFSEPPEDYEGPSGTVVDSRTAGDLGTDVYALSTAQGIIGHASAFREAIVRARTRIPDDAGLFLSGVATPANVALLAYAGVDLVDTTRVRIAATQGRYLTPEGARPIDELTELTCPCPACASEVASFDRADCETHNVAVLRAALATVRERIRAGTLREHVSGRVRQTPWLTAALRQLDDATEFQEERAPLYRQSQLLATTDDDLYRPEIRRYWDRVTERYRNRLDAPLILLPCSAKKPYSESQSHRQFREAIRYRGHMVSLSSPVGVVPDELECTYPAQHYDIPVTGRWSATEREVIGEVLSQYLARNEYPEVIAHVAPGPYRELVEQAADHADVTPVYTAEDHPTTGDSLAALADALEGYEAYSRDERRTATVRALADYQFGAGAGDALFAGCTVESPYPKHRVLDEEGAHLATMVPEYGLLALTIEGAHRWHDSEVPSRTVSIDAFVPHGDVLAPGITDADPSIRVGDEVIVAGPKAFCVGRAAMHGRAMIESTRGVAIDVRHTEERDA